MNRCEACQFWNLSGLSAKCFPCRRGRRDRSWGEEGFVPKGCLGVSEEGMVPTVHYCLSCGVVVDTFLDGGMTCMNCVFEVFEDPNGVRLNYCYDKDLFEEVGWRHCPINCLLILNYEEIS